MAAPQAQAPDVRDLLALAIADPAAAEVLADDLLASDSDPTMLSIAHQAKGIVLRDRGLLDARRPLSCVGRRSWRTVLATPIAGPTRVPPSA